MQKEIKASYSDIFEKVMPERKNKEIFRALAQIFLLCHYSFGIHVSCELREFSHFSFIIIMLD